MKQLINKLLVLNKGEIFGRLAFAINKKTKKYDRFLSKNLKNVPTIELLNIFSKEERLTYNQTPFVLNYCGKDIDVKNIDICSKSDKWYLLKESCFAGDIREFWEPARLQFINLLISNYLVTKNHSIVEEIDNYLSWWFENNPIDCGFNHISNLEIAIRFLVLYRVYFYFGKQIKTDLNSILYQYGLHLFFDLHRTNLCVPNNHSLGEATSLLLAARIFRNRKWEEYAKKTIGKRINLINDFGESIEESSGYQLFVTQMMIVILSITDEFDHLILPKIVKSKISLKSISDKYGNIGKYGDCDDGLFFNFDSFERNNIKCIESNFFISSNKIETFESNYKNTEYIYEKTSKYLKVVEKDKWKVAMIGGYEINHSHIQCLSILAWYDGVQTIFSPGSYRYNGTEEKTRLSLSSQKYSNAPITQKVERNNFITKFRHKRIIKKVSIVMENDKKKNISGKVVYKGQTVERNIAIENNQIVVFDEANNTLLPYYICVGDTSNTIRIQKNKTNCPIYKRDYSPKYGVLQQADYYAVDSNSKTSMIFIGYEKSSLFNKV